MDVGILKDTDKALLLRCARGPISFTHAIDLEGHVQTRVIRSTIPPQRQKELHALALRALVAETVTGCGGHGEPPEHTVSYTLTAFGRVAIGLHAPDPVRTRGSTALTDEQLAAEGIE